MAEAVLTGIESRNTVGGAKVLGGALIVTGTSIGAGVFSLPVITSGGWFGWSLVMLVVSWYCMYSAGLYLMEANLRYREGASFDTLAQNTLGNAGRIINGLAVAFVCYVLTYAYISGGSSIIAHTLESIAGLTVSTSVAGLVFAVGLGLVVVLGPLAVDQITTVLLGGMLVTFLGFASGLVSNASSAYLFPGLSLAETSPFIWVTLPFVMVSFGFQTCVPSLTAYMNREARALRQALLLGSLLALAFYVVWQLSIFGNLSREAFPAINAAGGNIASLVEALEQNGLNMKMSGMLQLFSHMAVATSFLGVSLGLFDYITDVFGFANDLKGRLKTAAITFIPPTALGILLPNGFITAIGFAGIGAAIFSVLTPVLMAHRSRKSDEGYQVPGGTPRMALVFLFGLSVLLLELLNLGGILPRFG
ncbi:MAG: aromatic amino acid transport family protein [Endozoicomonas sp.]